MTGIILAGLVLSALGVYAYSTTGSVLEKIEIEVSDMKIKKIGFQRIETFLGFSIYNPSRQSIKLQKIVGQINYQEKKISSLDLDGINQPLLPRKRTNLNNIRADITTSEAVGIVLDLIKGSFKDSVVFMGYIVADGITYNIEKEISLSYE